MFKVNPLDKLHSEIDQHLKRITHLQEQIANEEQGLFECFEREELFMIKLQQDQTSQEEPHRSALTLGKR